MRKLKKRRRWIAVLLTVSACLLTFIGCWDNHELNTLFIVTGVGLDQEQDSDQIRISLEIGKAKAEQEESGKSPNPSIVFRTVSPTMMEGLSTLDRDSSRNMLLQHNQVLLFGEDLAKKGIEEDIDWFVRDQESRMEVLVMVAAGKAEDVLSASLVQESISGIYLSRMVQDLNRISPYYKVRMIDFVSRLREETSAPVAPMVSLVDTGEEKKNIKLEGFAVFKHGKMIGRLNEKEMQSYVWSMGRTERCNVVSDTPEGSAVFHVKYLNVNTKVALSGEDRVKVSMEAEATLNVGQLRGFEGVSQQDFLPVLTKAAEEQIQRQIERTFQKAQEMNADIYGIGTDISRKHPKQWKEMKDRWDEIFPRIQLEVKTKVSIPGTGQIVQSLKMEEGEHEN